MKMKDSDKTSFPNRISYLNRLFGYEKVASYLNQDEIDVLKWANSDTLLEPPVKIDYTYFLAHRGTDPL